jgi:hypothetical protein
MKAKEKKERRRKKKKAHFNYRGFLNFKAAWKKGIQPRTAAMSRSRERDLEQVSWNKCRQAERKWNLVELKGLLQTL